MPLFVVATPIGDPEDLSPRAQRILIEADLIVGEEAKPTRRLLAPFGLQAKTIELLNEHSTAEDVQMLVEHCRSMRVALVTDCGTPGFCDPGAELVAACRSQGIPVHSAPGPSSLMTFLSLTGLRLDQFVFFGFLPRRPPERLTELKRLAQEQRAVVLMETPYRVHQLIDELSEHLPERPLMLGLDLSTTLERIVEGRPRAIKKMQLPPKPECVLMLLPILRTPHHSPPRERAGRSSSKSRP